MIITLVDESEHNNLRDIILRIDNPADQHQLAQWMAQGKVLAVHSHEATLEEVFIKVAGVNPALPAV
jgi:ABC-2 type transport system ATP-binding protein